MKKLNLLLFLLTTITFAKPLQIEDILTDKNKFKLNSTISYTNIDTKSINTKFVKYDISENNSITIPIVSGENLADTDYLNFSLDLKYGISKKLELFSFVNFYYSKNRYSLNDNFSNNSESDFNSFGIGLSYEIKSEDEYPSLLIGLSTQAIEKTKFYEFTNNNYFRNTSLFATSFYTSDPIVFLLNLSYQLNFDKKINNQTLNNANVLNISPQIYFAVNPYTSLNLGVKYSYSSKDKINNINVSNSSSDIMFLFGVGYEINSKSIISVDTDFTNSSNYSQNSIAFTYSYKF